MKKAELGRVQVAKLKRLEFELSSVLVAIEPSPPFADLTPGQLKELRAWEGKLGVILVAYESEKSMEERVGTLAELDASQLARLQAFERGEGVLVLGYRGKG